MENRKKVTVYITVEVELEVPKDMTTNEVFAKINEFDYDFTTNSEEITIITTNISDYDL